MEYWFVYILQSEKDNNSYTGYTNDLERRLKEPSVLYPFYPFSFSFFYV